MNRHSREGEFGGKVRSAAARGGWMIEIAPRVSEMPAPIQKYDDPFLPYSRAVIEATAALVAGYVFDLAAYLALGAAGAIALERSVAIAAADGGCITVLHGPFARGEYAALAGAGTLNVDAATVIDRRVAEAFEAEGVRGLVMTPDVSELPDAYNGHAIRIEGVQFGLLRQSFLDQFKRDDFAEALRNAVAGLAR